MHKEPISRGTSGLINPITGSYILLDDDGNIRIGLETYGDAMVFTNNGELYINCDKVHYISSEITWNELRFNKAAVSPSQPALTKTSTNVKQTEIANYDRLASNR